MRFLDEYPKYTGSEPCAEMGSDMFYTDNVPEMIANLPLLRETCARCPIQAECLEWGIKHESYGFWGGATLTERARIRKARGITLVRPDIWYTRGVHQRDMSDV